MLFTLCRLRRKTDLNRSSIVLIDFDRFCQGIESESKVLNIPEFAKFILVAAFD